MHKSWTSHVLWQNGYQNVAEGLGITFIATFFVSRSFFQQHKVNYLVEKLGNLMMSVLAKGYTKEGFPS